jgi:hypothetical protein
LELLELEMIAHFPPASPNAATTDAQKNPKLPPRPPSRLEALGLAPVPPQPQPAARACPVASHFRCGVQHTLECSRCHHQSTVQETFTHLSLDVETPESMGSSASASACAAAPLRTLLTRWFDAEAVERRCDACGHGEATASHRICTLPRTLVLHLKVIATAHFRNRALVSLPQSSQPPATLLLPPERGRGAVRAPAAPPTVQHSLRHHICLRHARVDLLLQDDEQ